MDSYLLVLLILIVFYKILETDVSSDKFLTRFYGLEFMHCILSLKTKFFPNMKAIYFLEHMV